MENLETLHIDGDASVGRNVAVGGRATVQGDMVIKHNLKVEGRLDAPNKTDANKGVFETVEALRLEYPKPANGWYGLVRSGDNKADLYAGKNGVWVKMLEGIDVATDGTTVWSGIKGAEGISPKVFIPEIQVQGEHTIQITDAEHDEEHPLTFTVKDGKDGKDAVSPFKGKLGTLAALNAAYPSPVAGEYAVVTVSGTDYVFRCGTDGVWPDSSTEVYDPSSDPVFGSGESLLQTRIVWFDEGGAGNVLSAEAGKTLNSEINGSLIETSDIIGNATTIAADVASNNWDGDPGNGIKRAGKLPIKESYKQIKVVGNGTYSTYLFFTTKEIPSVVDLTLQQLQEEYFPISTDTIKTALNTAKFNVPTGAKYLYFSKKTRTGTNREPASITPIVNDGNGIVNKIPDHNSVTVFTVSGGVGISNGEVQITDNAARRHCPRFFETSELERVAVANGYLVMAVYFDESLLYKGQSQYAQEVKIEKRYKYALFAVKKTDGTDFAVNDNEQLTLYSFGVTIYDLSKQTCKGVALDALFETNLLTNDKLINQTTLWTSYSQNAVLYDSADLSFPKSWHANGTYNTTYQSVQLKEGHKYLIACESKFEEIATLTYAQNMLDMRNSKTGVNNTRIVGIYATGLKGACGFASHPERGYRIALRTFEMPVENTQGNPVSKNVTIGNICASGKLQGYVRNPVVIDLTELGLTTASRKSLYKAYRDYVNYLRCQPVSDYNKSVDEDVNVVYTDPEARGAFVDEMNKIATELGCVDSVFCNPSGVLTTDHLVTCKDFLKIGAAAMTENAFLRIINTHQMDVPMIDKNGVAGVIDDVVAGYSGVENTGSDVLLTNYDIVAAKTGSWGGDTQSTNDDTQTLVMVVRSKSSGKFIVGYIHHATSTTEWYNNKYTYIKNLFDKVEDESVILNLGDTDHWAAGYIPPITQWAKYVDFGTVKNDDSVQFPPASTTKYLTCMIVLQHMAVDELVEYVAADYSSGSGSAVADGDKFRLRDAVFCCMASSSNSLANMLARWCGYRLLEEQNK